MRTRGASWVYEVVGWCAAAYFAGNFIVWVLS